MFSFYIHLAQGNSAIQVMPGGSYKARFIYAHPMSNPRYSNGALRRKHRARFKAMDAPCGICKGRLGPIHYDEPSDSAHPLSFVIDEIRPISKYKLFGYNSRAEAAKDWNNLQAAHFCCNQAKGAKIGYVHMTSVSSASGEW